jgi:cell division protein FtsZ
MTETIGQSEASKRTADMVSRKLGLANITVVGVGGGGSSTISRLMQQKAPGVNFVCVNTDIRALQSLRGEGLIIVPIGESVTQGFGAGGKPEVGEEAAVSGRAALAQVLSGSDIVFICTGLGGGTGTGAAPVVAEVARSLGALTIGMATLPFSWEGHKRMETALSGLKRMKENVDNIILIHNDRLGDLASGRTAMPDVFKMADSVVAEGILVVAEIVNIPGDINVDLADIRSVMSLRGEALMAIGTSSGPLGAQEAAEKAIKNPLLDISISGAKGILFTVKSGPKLSLGQVNAAGKRISKAVSPDAMIFFGMQTVPDMGDEVKITIIATGIPEPGQQAPTK